MKSVVKSVLTVAACGSMFMASAQQWNGSTTPTGTINRSGSVGIGFTGTPYTLLTTYDNTKDAQALFGCGRTSGKSEIGVGYGWGGSQMTVMGFDPTSKLGYVHVGGTTAGNGIVFGTGSNNMACVGIGLSLSKSALTDRLTVDGSIKSTSLNVTSLKVTGSTPAAGKVLTSDASGNATWQTPVTPTNYWSGSGTDIYRASGKVGIGTSTMNSTLQVEGSIGVKVTDIQQAPYPASDEAMIITDGYTVTLPNPLTVKGRTYIIQNVNNGNTCNVNAIGSTSISFYDFGNYTSQVRLGMGNQPGATIQVVCDNNGTYRVVSKY